MTLKVTPSDSNISEAGKFPCISCHTNCCKEYVIFVNAHDIYRLSVGLGLPPENFLEIYGAKDYDLGIKVKEGLLDLALKQKDGGCIFLEESKDVFRCTVNDFKPSVCKSYPFQMKNRKLIQMSDKMCPVEWNTKEFEDMMLTHLKKDEDEWKFYDKLIQEWNAMHWRKKPLSEFLKFILNRVVLERSII
ncbi:MAG: YkgJ family cysteine cluster protein [Nitrosopumilus sp.]|nr:YkgJ family cysteine cluster protein [Nitrosopumilus sp.]MDH3515821.1 YkgJ family cysteine cluster protein [Nitrosopumilus sp.]MDH5416695.1 YkgJ family cysteine cluster protein [Nitrosopumilus sp.]MDH5554429.1 YkgJ family cysteine cluster protein [Nitrosopumilus sp.]